MEIRQLEAFAILSECLSVTRTAERLFCTQPAVSISIRKLEESLNTTLFERTNNRLRLTPQGRTYREYVLQILSLAKQSQEHMRLFDHPESGSINIGASHFCGVWVLPSVIAQFNKKYPNITIRLDIDKTGQLLQKLNVHDVDFVVISDYINVSSEKNTLMYLMDDPFVLICHPQHKLASKKICTQEELKSETFLIKPQHSTTRMFMDKCFSMCGIQLGNLIEIDSLEGIKQGVIHGLGVSVVPARSVSQEIRTGLLSEVVLPNVAISRRINSVQHKDKLSSPAAQLFLTEIKNSLTEW
ncbi:LysR family transcriptional regulator [Serratia aquatilis]|uniref:LysR family transcriptional regulator n=1 Tax=Serratia aquatilis TaxID=1737515 RepID=A0ABV6EC99_9GAMM